MCIFQQQEYVQIVSHEKICQSPKEPSPYSSSNIKQIYVMFWTICYHLYNLKNVKYHSSMDVFYVFEIAQMVSNRAMQHILTD